jgi:Xaa-Pro aminopeptidase
MYPHQHERLTEALERARLDALVAASPANVAYLTGFRSLARAVAPALETYAVVTRAGTALVVPTLDAPAVVEAGVEVGHLACHGRFHFDTAAAHGDAAQRLGRLVAEPAATAADALAAVLAQLDVDGGRVGLDDAGLPAPRLAALRERLGAATLLPGSAALTAARVVKGPYEIDRLQRALHVAEEAVNVVLALLGAGVTEREAAEAFEREVIAQGATPYCTIVAFGAGAAIPAPWPSDRALRAGDFVRFDLGCVVDGYHSDVARMAVLGEPTRSQQAAFDALHAGLEAALHAVRPGAAGADALHAAIEAARRAGLPRFARHHVGHGIGLEPVEPPWLAPDGGALEMGTVLRVETPYYVVGESGLNVKETVLVTRTGAHALNRSHRGLVVLD